MARLAIGHSHIDGNPVTRHRHPYQCGTTTQSPTRTPSHTFTTNEQVHFPLKNHLVQPLRPKPHRRITSPPSKETSTSNFLTASRTHLLNTVLLSQFTSHTGAHLMQLSSEAYEAGDRCFRVSVARRLMLPHTAAPNAADVVQSCANKSAAGLMCDKSVDTQQHHCYGCRYGGGVDRRHATVGRCLADVIQSHSGAKVFIEQEVPALTRVVNGQTEHARMDLVFLTSTLRLRIWMCPLLLLSLATRLWSQQAAPEQDTWPKELRRANSTYIHTSTSSLSYSRPQADLDHTPGNSLTTSCETLTTLH